MKKLSMITLSVVGLALASSPAFARTFAFSGNSCQSTTPTNGCAVPGQWGMGNACTSAVTVICPLNLSAPVNPNILVGSVSWDAFDRSSVDNVVCTIHRTDGAGNDFFTPLTSQTSGNASGVQNKLFTGFPANQSALDPWWVICSIPGSTSSGFSHLVDFFVNTSE